jgi:geranylgeranyl transferase type-2 subunit beta
MDGLPYLFRLAARLGDGLAARPAAFRDRHAAFLLSQQQPDGGFAGREGGADLYYTGFGVRGLALLDRLDAAAAERLAGYLRATAAAPTGIIDLLSWLYAALAVQMADGPELLAHADDGWRQGLAEWIEGFRRPDGGYAKGPDGADGSTYHTFLALLARELLDQPPADPDAARKFLLGRQREDGGFVEQTQMPRSGANPTAAAVGALLMLGGVPEDVHGGVGEFLAEIHSPEGGYQANTRIDFADALSTFTALLTARDLGLPAPDAEIARYLAELEAPAGGFHGASWDRKADVEYTFYALGGLALLG